MSWHTTAGIRAPDRGRPGWIRKWTGFLGRRSICVRVPGPARAKPLFSPPPERGRNERPAP